MEVDGRGEGGGDGENETLRLRRLAKVPLTEDQKRMVEDYAKQWPSPAAVYSTVYRLHWRCAKAVGLEDEDLEQLCWLGVMKAAKSFDPAFGASFATYAASKMRGTVGHWITGRTAAGRTREKGVQLLSGDWAGEDGTAAWAWMQATREADGSDGDRETIRLAVAGVLRQLTERLRMVVELRWGLNGYPEMTLEEVGAELGITRERVRQLEAKAMDRVRIPLALAGGPLIGMLAEAAG